MSKEMNKMSDILMDGIDEMHKIMKDIDKGDFNIDKAKMKIATNNSLTATAKVYLQTEIMKQMAKGNLEKDRRIIKITSKK